MIPAKHPNSFVSIIKFAGMLANGVLEPVSVRPDGLLFTHSEEEALISFPLLEMLNIETHADPYPINNNPS